MMPETALKQPCGNNLGRFLKRAAYIFRLLTRNALAAPSNYEQRAATSPYRQNNLNRSGQNRQLRSWASVCF